PCRRKRANPGTRIIPAPDEIATRADANPGTRIIPAPDEIATRADARPAPTRGTLAHYSKELLAMEMNENTLASNPLPPAICRGGPCVRLAGEKEQTPAPESYQHPTK
ncbi:MAG: hypothetical protein ABI151_17060, partial [Chitinophagaceae bacterium]